MKRNTSYTFEPVNKILKIFLLTNIKCINNSVVPISYLIIKSVTVILLLGVINIIFLIYKLDNFSSSNGHFQFYNTIQTIYWLGYLQYIVDVFYTCKTRKSFVKYLEFYKTIDRIIQDPDWSSIRTSLSKTFIGYIVLFFLFLVLELVSWYIGMELKPALLYSISYFYAFINYLTIPDFVCQVIQIEYRLRVMVIALKKYQYNMCSLNDNCDRLTIEDVVISTSIWIRPSLSRYICFDEVDKVNCLKKLYLYLSDQATSINDFFGVRLLICMLSQLILLIHLTNIIIRNLIKFDVNWNTSYHLPVLTNTIWLILSGLVHLTLVYRCEQSYQQCKNAINIIDHTVITHKNINGDLKSALTELRELIRSRPLKFSAAGFFTINYPLLASIASVVTTYTIIIFQSYE